MTISPSELRTALDILLTHLESSGVTNVSLDSDYYWELESWERYNQNNQPKTFMLGQLSFDSNEIREIALGTRAPSLQGLIWLGNLLRYIGEEQGLESERGCT